MKRTALLLLIIFNSFLLAAQSGTEGSLSDPSMVEDDISVGPWVTNVTDSTMSVLWTSGNKGLGWVETADGRRIYDTYAGRRVFGTFHRVDVGGVRGNVVYRVGGELLTDDSNPRYPEFGAAWESAWSTVRLFDSGSDTLRFSVLNDIHNDTRAYSQLAGPIEDADFLFLNGDIASTGNLSLDDYVRYEIAPLGGLSAGLPLMFARGNHEGRGNGIQHVGEIYPSSNPGKFYYTFRQGPAAFVVLDGGETGEGRSILYSGTPVYEDYLEEQIKWARKALFSEEFASAPLKICLLHVPMIDHEDKDDFKLHRWLNQHFVPLLNSAGIDIMIGADLHEHMICPAGTMGNDFPIIVNASLVRLDVTASDGSIRLSFHDKSGTELSAASFVY